MLTMNLRIHKASYKEFVQATAEISAPAPKESFTNYTSYEDTFGRPRIGHFDLEKSTITPLAMKSGALLNNLYEVIEVGDTVPAGEPFPLDSVKLLPPISGRDILCVGKNYSEHAKEFHKSGYDSSDKTAQRKLELPSHS